MKGSMVYGNPLVYPFMAVPRSIPRILSPLSPRRAELALLAAVLHGDGPDRRLTIAD